MNFTRENLDLFREDFDIAMRALQSKHGINVKLGTQRFEDIGFTAKITVHNADFDKNTFTENCRRYGLVPTDFGRSFLYKTRTFEIIGLDLKKRRFPLKAKNIVNGKTAGFPAEFVANAMNHSTPVDAPAAPAAKLSRKDQIRQYCLDNMVIHPNAREIASALDMNPSYVARLLTQLGI